MNVDVSNEERDECNELLRISGYKNATISLSNPPWHPQILADQLTLSQAGGQIMPT